MHKHGFGLIQIKIIYEAFFWESVLTSYLVGAKLAFSGNKNKSYLCCLLNIQTLSTLIPSFKCDVLCSVSKFSLFVSYWRGRLFCQHDYRFFASFFVYLQKKKKASRISCKNDIKTFHLHAAMCLPWTVTCMFVNNEIYCFDNHWLFVNSSHV